eukprot:7582440-Ditylum_brightwellii.AAC.1
MRSQHIKDLKKAELDTHTTSNEAGFILHIVKICLAAAMACYQELLETNFGGTHLCPGPTSQPPNPGPTY